MEEQTKYELDREAHHELRELLEDSISYWCREHMISGELAWLVTETIAQTKVAMFKGYIK